METNKTHLKIKEQETVYSDFMMLCRYHNRTSEDSRDLASQFFLEYIEGGYDLIRLSPQYRGFVKKRCLREWTKRKRERDRLYLYRFETEQLQEFREEPSRQLKELLSGPKGKLVSFLIAGNTRREIADKMQRSVGWVQKEIQRLMVFRPMQEIVRDYKVL